MSTQTTGSSSGPGTTRAEGSDSPTRRTMNAAGAPAAVAFTPGPWKVCGAEKNGKPCICHGVGADDGTTIAKWYGDDNGWIDGITEQCPKVAEGYANAHLIAAAPALYAAVQTRVEWQLARGDAELERKFCERHGIDPKKQTVEMWLELGETAALLSARGGAK